MRAVNDSVNADHASINSNWSNVVTVEIEPEVEKISYAAVYDTCNQGTYVLVMGNILEGEDIPATFENDGNTLPLTKGWTNIESSGQVWRNYSYDITSVYILDTISPISTASWFGNFRNCEKWIGLDHLDMSKCTDVKYMFLAAGYYIEEVNISNMENWDMSNVIDMKGMFNNAGACSSVVNIGDLSNWNVSNVSDMAYMFFNLGYRANDVKIGNIENWDVSNVTDMHGMFFYAFEQSTNINIGDLSNWDVSNVTDMTDMFNRMGYKANYTLDLSLWDVRNVIEYSGFNQSVGSKVVAPTWVN